MEGAACGGSRRRRPASRLQLARRRRASARSESRFSESSSPLPRTPRRPARASRRRRRWRRRPASSRSSTQTRAPRRAARQAQARPITPPPTTSRVVAVSARGSDAVLAAERSNLPAPALPGSGSDGRRRFSRPLSPWWAPVSPPSYPCGRDLGLAEVSDRNLEPCAWRLRRGSARCAASGSTGRGSTSSAMPVPAARTPSRCCARPRPAASAWSSCGTASSPATRSSARRPDLPAPRRHLRRALHRQRRPRAGRASCKADGVHVGQDDIAAAEAREILGPDAIIGLSTHSREQIEAAHEQPVDYISVGPIWETPTKEGRPGDRPRADPRGRRDRDPALVRDRRHRPRATSARWSRRAPGGSAWCARSATPTTPRGGEGAGRRRSRPPRAERLTDGKPRAQAGRAAEAQAPGGRAGAATARAANGAATGDAADDRELPGADGRRSEAANARGAGRAGAARRGRAPRGGHGRRRGLGAAGARLHRLGGARRGRRSRSGARPPAGADRRLRRCPLG